MKREWLLAGIAAILVVVSFVAGSLTGPSNEPLPDPTPRPLGWLRDVQGTVLVGGTAGGTAASAKTPMAARHELASDPSSRATLDLRRAGTLSVGPRTALRV